MGSSGFPYLELGDIFLDALGGGGCPLDMGANNYEFVLNYQLTIDTNPFDWVGYKHLIPVYQDTHPFKVWMAGAQTGKSAMLMVDLTRNLGLHWGKLFGYYFPDKHLPTAFSRNRYKPFLLSNPELGRLLGSDRKDGSKGVDNVLTRSWGESTVFFMTTGGTSSTEGLPLAGTYFDEVRRMPIGDIERAMERYSAQREPIDVKVSTARYNESDIHKFFLEGDQRYFHSDCRCGEGVVLSLTFPDCIADLRSASPALLRKVEHAYSTAGIPYLGLTAAEQGKYPPAAFICPRCGEIIVDPRDGWWEPHGTGWAHSYQMPQMLSPTYSAGRVLEKYERGKDIQEFHNSCRGMPFIDESKRPVKDSHLRACVNSELRWPGNRSATWRRQYMKNTAAGVDVQKGYLVLVVKEYAPNGKHRTIHLEVVHGTHENDPWYTLGKRMLEYDVRFAVIDQAPEFNAAANFARAFRGRVYLANYDAMAPGSDMVQWGDSKATKAVKGNEQRFPWRVNIDRTKGLQWSLGRWVRRLNEVPDPRSLAQMIPRQGDKMVLSPDLRVGTMVLSPICELYFDHLQRIIFQSTLEDAKGPARDKKEARGQDRIVAEFIGVDPHFAHADLYASVALDRMPHRTRSSA